MLYLYSFLFYLATPAIFLRLLWRSRRLPAYRQRLLERLGFYPHQLTQSIWVHAVSVGEVLAAVPLIKELIQCYPNRQIVVTTMTPTGAEQVLSQFKHTVTHYYIPYDLPCAVKRFIKRINPQVAIIMETEIWPNLLNECAKQQVPVFLLNARLSAKSAQGYARIASITEHALRCIKMIAAHGAEDAARFAELGADPANITVTGNIKFDLQLPANLLQVGQAIRERLGKRRFVWIAASTHGGEEEILLAAHSLLLQTLPTALLLLVPRHPDRFDAVYKLSASKLSTVRRSLNEDASADTQVYLADTMGELLNLYSAADVAFIGGSLIARGGHNMLEPGALGLPLLIGPSTYNFKEIAQLFLQAGAMQKITNAEQLAEQLLTLANSVSLRSTIGAKAREVVEANRGALQKQLQIVTPYINK